MTAKEYLSQAHRLDQRVNNKLLQIESLRSMAEKVTSSYQDSVVSHTRNVTSLEETVIRLMKAENELNQQIDALVDLKNEMLLNISAINNIDLEMLLEKRYLHYLSWEEIARDMGFSVRWVHSLHTRALVELDTVLQKRSAVSLKVHT